MEQISTIGYNAWNKGLTGERTSMWGKKHSLKTRKLMSEKAMGNTHGFEKGHTAWNKGKKCPQCSHQKNVGRPCSKEKKQKLREKRLGKKWEDFIPNHEEARRKLSKIVKKRFKDGFVHPMKGKRHTKETIKKIKEKRAKQIFTKETIRKRAKSNSENYKNNPERGKKMSKIFKELRKKQKFPLKDTKIELKIQKFLSLLHIEYLAHKHISGITNAYQCDILIPKQINIFQNGEIIEIKQKTIIECDGCYWHGCPICNKWESKNIAKQIKRDKLRTKELEQQGYKVIRLWEHEIRPMRIKEFERRLK